MHKKKLIYFINVDWYFRLHWLERALAAKQDYDVYIITKFTSENIKEELTSLGFICVDIELTRRSINPFKEIITFTKFVKLVRRISPDVVHSITIKPNLYSSLVSRFIKANSIRSITGLGAIFSNSDLKFRFIRYIVLNVLKFKGDGHSKHSYTFENYDDLMLFQENGFAKNFKLVYIAGAGVDTKKYSYTPLPSKPFTILFAARLIKSKGLEQLIEAVSVLRAQGYNLILNVAGICDDDVREAIPIQLINKWHAEGVINWLGNISNMPQQISFSHVVCLPSRYGEGVPRILLEGASCGRALITNNISGCRDIVVDGKTGILTQVGDVSSLVNAIAILYSDPIMCEQFGKNGRDLVKQKFEQSLVISSFLSLYSQ